MRYWRLSLRGGRVWAIVALIGLLACTAQGAGKKRGRPIEFSAPNSDEVTTNLHKLTSRKDSLKELEEDLYKSMQTFAPKSSLDGVAAPPSRLPAGPVIPNKRVKELLERRKNWFLMRPDDLLAEPTLKEILRAPEYGKDGREKQPIPALERYFERFATKRPAADRPDQLKDDERFGSVKKSSSGDETAAHDDPDLPSGLKESAQALKKLFAPDTGGGLSAREGTPSRFSNPFGLGDNTLSKEQVLEHNKLMDQFNSTLDPSWHRPTAANPFNQPFGLPEAGQPKKIPAGGLASSSGPAPHTGLDAQMDVRNPMLGPAGLPDVNARALGQTRPALAPPSVEAPKVATPTFTAPRRAF